MLAGIVPLLVIAASIVGSIVDSGGEVPDFAIYISTFVFFNLFVVNVILQYRETWRWREYLVGEKRYSLLSLVAKSAFALQVYFGTLTSPG